MDAKPAAMRDLIANAYRDLILKASDDFKACWMAGVPMNFTSEMTPTGMKITATTAHPCAVVHDPLTHQTTVYQKASK